MLRTMILIGMILIMPNSINAQVRPAEGKTLNYRLVGFSFPGNPLATGYTLKIAAGSYETEDSFNHNVISTQPCNTCRTIAEVPAFGRQYTWQVVYNCGSRTTSSPLYHFSTGTIPEADTTNLRLRIMTPAGKFNDACVLVDGRNVMYDMTGKPIWYLPTMEGNNLPVVDLKLSPRGTITYIAGAAYEINYDGDVLWQTPANTTVDNTDRTLYHHEFSRLANGHYMVLAMHLEPEWQRPPAPVGSTDTAKILVKVPHNFIVEYDESGKIVWSWKSDNYITSSDLACFAPRQDRPMLDLHENSFFFDEKNNYVYLSFKGISRIIKIKYPEGNVVSSYGDKLGDGKAENGNNLFCGQHAVRFARDGGVLMFDNNNCNPGMPPKIIKLREPATANDTLAHAWEYRCTVEEDSSMVHPSGGNVVELEDHSLFVSMGNLYGKLFIVSPDKKVLWSAMPERWNFTEKKWFRMGQYRASIIENRQLLENLIWNTPTDNTALVVDKKMPERSGTE